MHPATSVGLSRKKRTIRISELFYSIEGEGPFSGLPTVFVRTFGCNFTCSGFSNPSENKVVPIRISKLTDFVPTVGCDSIYAWHPSYKDLTAVYTMPDLAQQIVSLLPGNMVRNPRSRSTPVLSFTGGEPTLHQRALSELLFEPDLAEFSKILIETNCAVTLTDDFLDALTRWSEIRDNLVVWSNSPKLRISGEIESDAIRPDVALAQQRVPNSIQYMKFVSDGTRASFEEISDVMEKFQNGTRNGIGKNSVYVMPLGATLAEQALYQTKVAELCLEYGYSFCARVHVSVFKNAIGT